MCQATGDPKPRVSWNKKGKKVNSQRIEVSPGALLRDSTLSCTTLLKCHATQIFSYLFAKMYFFLMPPHTTFTSQVQSLIAVGLENNVSVSSPTFHPDSSTISCSNATCPAIPTSLSSLHLTDFVSVVPFLFWSNAYFSAYCPCLCEPSYVCVIHDVCCSSPRQAPQMASVKVLIDAQFLLIKKVAFVNVGSAHRDRRAHAAA